MCSVKQSLPALQSDETPLQPQRVTIKRHVSLMHSSNAVDSLMLMIKSLFQLLVFTLPSNNAG